MLDPKASTTQQAMALLPSGLFLMTAAHEGKRTGAMVASVQPCAMAPPLLCIAMRKGAGIEPMIRDAHTFAINIVDPSDKLVMRKFGDPSRPREPGDPFDCMPIERLVTGAPVLKRSIARWFDTSTWRRTTSCTSGTCWRAGCMGARGMGGSEGPGKGEKRKAKSEKRKAKSEKR